MKTTYTALLVAPDGDYVTDYEGQSLNEVLEQLSDRGSRWFFYPFEFVIRLPFRLNSRIVNSPVSGLEGKSVKTILETVKSGALDYLLW